MLYVGNGGIGLHITEQLVRNIVFLEHFDYLVGHMETDQVLVCHKESLLETSSGHFYGDIRPTSRTEIGCLVQNHSIHGIIIKVK